MFIRAMVQRFFIIFVLGIISFGQDKPRVSTPPGVLEFPVVFLQSIDAGKTAVGSTIQAKLTVATLVNRVVIPKYATFSGVVLESVAKSDKNPSRLAIRMESVHWKDGSVSIKAYLAPWYYPKTVAAGPDLQYGPPEPPAKTWNGAGQYPNADSRVYQPFPGADSDQSKGAIPDTTSSTTSSSTTRMKDVTLAPTADGGLALVSERANLKLDKQTTYVLAAAGP